MEINDSNKIFELNQGVHAQKTHTKFGIVSEKDRLIWCSQLAKSTHMSRSITLQIHDSNKIFELNEGIDDQKLHTKFDHHTLSRS